MKALDRNVEMLGLWIVTSSVTFIKSVNQSSIKPCLDLISYKNLVLDQDDSFYLIRLSIRITCLLNHVWVLYGEVTR